MYQLDSERATNSGSEAMNGRRRHAARMRQGILLLSRELAKNLSSSSS
jgi:hypothetical protein